MPTELTPLQTEFHWRRLNAITKTPHPVTQEAITEQLALLHADHVAAQIARDCNLRHANHLQSMIDQRDHLIANQLAMIERLTNELASYRTPETAVQPALDLALFERLAHTISVIRADLDETQEAVDRAIAGEA